MIMRTPLLHESEQETNKGDDINKENSEKSKNVSELTPIENEVEIKSQNIEITVEEQKNDVPTVTNEKQVVFQSRPKLPRSPLHDQKIEIPVIEKKVALSKKKMSLK